MKLADTNVLIYAVNSASQEHHVARGWLDDALSGSARVGFSWDVLLGFVRLTTRAGLMPRPLTVDEAFTAVDGWLSARAAEVVHPTTRHAEILSGLLRAVGTGGNLTSDAHLAALSIEHRAQIVTFDSDFARFPGVRWERPQPPRSH